MTRSWKILSEKGGLHGRSFTNSMAGVLHCSMEGAPFILQASNSLSSQAIFAFAASFHVAQWNTARKFEKRTKNHGSAS